jgi:formate dehydrogenase (NADP+) alpha subunit
LDGLPDAITITLDGREVSGHPGMTLLELAGEAGVRIPTLCHDPLLPPAGACRICIVEEERSGAILASCVTPITSGMVVNTSSPRVLERRKLIVEMMLASHPDSCFVCDKGNRCQLRRIASELEIGLLRLDRIPQAAAIQEVNPFIERDLSRCILCARCIRADHELVVQGAIDYFDRGFDCKPATLGDRPLEGSAECTFCGTCVAVCPTGALMERDRVYRGTTSTAVSTTCPACGCGCGVSLEVRGGRIVRALPDRESPVNRGALCVKGSYGYDFVHSPERLTSPLVRVDGRLQEASWDRALEVAAGGMERIGLAGGPDSLAVLASSKCTNEENYLLQRFTRAVLGTNNIDNGSRLYGSSGWLGLGRTLGSPGSTAPLDSLERSETILVIGADPGSSAPVVGYAIRRAVRHGGAKLIVVDPRRTDLSPFASLWLRPRAGTDLALANGLARVIVEEGLLSEEFVFRRTDNFEAFADSLGSYSLDRVEEMTGVRATQLREAAALFAGAHQSSIVFGNGITQQVNGTDTVMALANLAMLTGNVGGRGGGIYALQRDANGQGACDMGALPDMLPGYQRVRDAGARERFERRWGVPVPASPGATALEMVQLAHDGKVRGMYVVGENPASSFPNLAPVRETLASLELLVVQDIFLTETARMATVVLPAASFAEKVGTFTNFEGRVQRIRKAIEPPGESLPDGEIVLRLARKMGRPMPYSSPEQVTDEIEEMVGLYQGSDFAGVTSTSRLARAALPRRLHGGEFPRAFHRFSPAGSARREPEAPDGYPFTLLVGTDLFQFGAGSRSSRASRLRRFRSQPFVDVSEADAHRLGIGEGDPVRLFSPTGEVSARARIDGAVGEGTLFMPASFPAAPVNVLFDGVVDPCSGTPALKACAVGVERIEPNG